VKNYFCLFFQRTKIGLEIPAKIPKAIIIRLANFLQIHSIIFLCYYFSKIMSINKLLK